jgi:hypothetical protein
MDSPIIISEKSSNAIVWILGFTGVIALAYYAYSKIPKKATVHGIQSASQSQLQSLASKLHEDISGLTFINAISLYQQAISLSDGDFIRLYNIYNELFQGQDGETLTEAVNGEFAWLGNYSFKVVKEEFLSRCSALNLP